VRCENCWCNVDKRKISRKLEEHKHVFDMDIFMHCFCSIAVNWISQVLHTCSCTAMGGRNITDIVD